MEPPHLSSTIMFLEQKIQSTRDINELIKTLFMYSKFIMDMQRAYSWSDKEEIGQKLSSYLSSSTWRGLIKINVKEVHFPPYIHFKNEEIDEDSITAINKKVPEEIHTIRDLAWYFDDPWFEGRDETYWPQLEKAIDDAFEKYMTDEDKEEYKKIYNMIY